MGFLLKPPPPNMAGHFLVPRCSTAETPPVPEVSRAGLLSLSYSLDTPPPPVKSPPPGPPSLAAAGPSILAAPPPPQSHRRPPRSSLAAANVPISPRAREGCARWGVRWGRERPREGRGRHAPRAGAASRPRPRTSSPSQESGVSVCLPPWTTRF